MRPMAVRKVGSSRLIREVGRGGMGVVYEATQEELGRKVAVKELTPELAANKEMLERFRREAQAYAQFRHETIPAIHDLVEKGDTLYMITEFVEGADLSKVIKNGGPVPPECVAIIGARVGEALDHVHLRGMLHRDIKPSNIMVGSDGTVKLMDFGIAFDEAADALTREGFAVGSPPYMSPEAFAGQKGDRRSDIWSLGVTLYELLSGERPFKGKDAQALFGAIRKGQHVRIRRKVPATPRALANVIDRCLKPKPEDRYGSCGEMARALAATSNELLRGVHPQVRMVGMMTHRQLLKQEDVTLINAESLVVTRQLDSDFSVDVVPDESIKPRRWPWLLAATAALMSAATWGATYMGWFKLPKMP